MKEDFEKLNVVLLMKRCHQLREEIEKLNVVLLIKGATR